MTGDCNENCPFRGGFLDYEPSAVGSAIFLAAFALLVPLTFFQGYRFKTPLFASTLATGILLEVLGFAGRLRLKNNVASETSFTLWLLGSILGPTLISAALCQVLPHVVALYGLGIGFTRPRVAGLSLVFALLLVVALEIAGVVAAVFGLGGVQSTTILLAGLGVQIAALLLFIGLYLWFTQKIPDPKHIAVYQQPRFRHFVKIMPPLAVVLIAHTIYRLVEYGEGLGGPLTRTEVASLIISGIQQAEERAPNVTGMPHAGLGLGAKAEDIHGKHCQRHFAERQHHIRSRETDSHGRIHSGQRYSKARQHTTGSDSGAFFCGLPWALALRIPHKSRAGGDAAS
ncbi:Sphingoid long-chain base transporter RSB1 [Colletotrichum sp. SAR 10_70]|nr:Sphingoid long-chain base transporter RSB1 [Colletotrichum sp. SAR 10_75]KAI8203314.1 Sphingoid long-chain base transporter RSB1 [Colletotrichum sp. SAR 10_70]KAI8234290.1 Sphingoid long-chain base transporter RSB1 [Colletotrichum sp. SAR 10_86]KAI8250977.1 Sphingoid long-chain base transporter RSB1 [Colletotrichum sp. SAR 10_77]